jgi:hypothetical protein
MTSEFSDISVDSASRVINLPNQVVTQSRTTLNVNVKAALKNYNTTAEPKPKTFSLDLIPPTTTE